VKPIDIRLYQGWIKQFLAVLAFASLFLVSYLCLYVLVHLAHLRSYGFLTLTILQFAFFISLILAWSVSDLLCIFLFAPVAATFTFLIVWVTRSPGFLSFILSDLLLCFLLYYLDQRKNAEVIVRNVEMEKAIAEKNDMELAFRGEGTSISVYFEKYTSYYNLRTLANDFSTTLVLADLGRMIVTKTVELISKGQNCLLYLAEGQTANLSLIASKSVDEELKIKAKSGDLFDFWVVRNRQSLIVTDTQKDFRFDLQKTQAADQVRSVIASPLVHEGKTIGTLRLNASQPSVFSTDDLRLLDAIAALASAAVSNSILYQRTEELAIRDSLTGLYVYRYFLERFLEEHKRSLLTNAPLTMLMCDLDHFKETNDRYGHGVGDYVLVKTASIISEKAGDSAIVARYGGEEFAILLPKMTAQEGRAIAESIRETVASAKLQVRREIIPVTISIGVASLPADTLDSEELIRIADKKLYEAKQKGRNRVCGGE
jgi:diguanylate cyclase (GGDEF)-like protein